MNNFLKRSIHINFMISILILTFCLSGCQTNAAVFETAKEPEECILTLDVLQNSINEERKKELATPLHNTVQMYGTVDEDAVEDFTEEEMDALIGYTPYTQKISREEALADVDTLMKLLKNSYAGYCYFGGDAKFKEAKERIIKKVNEAYGDENNITGKLNKILLDELAFIEDSHFGIGAKNTNFKEKYIFYDTTETNFYQDTAGYYTLINDEKHYFPAEAKDYLHVTVDDEGNLVYGIFALSEDSAQLPQEFILKTADNTDFPLNISWAQVKVGYRLQSPAIHGTDEIDGIKVTALGHMSISEQDLGTTNDFINDAQDLRNENAFILDLRGNVGGFELINQFFLYNLTGSLCDFNSQRVKRYSNLNKYNEMVQFQALGGDNHFSVLNHFDFYKDNTELVDAKLAETFHYTQTEPGETIIKDFKGEWKDYENTIIVLIDKKTFSSGELFLYSLSTVNNVIFMGSNSNGCLLTGDTNALCKTALPNSGITISYSQVILYTDKSIGFDSNGWMPDIITRGDALESAVSMLKAAEKE